MVVTVTAYAPAHGVGEFTGHSLVNSNQGPRDVLLVPLDFREGCSAIMSTSHLESLRDFRQEHVSRS
jgi:hypothetical protein